MIRKVYLGLGSNVGDREWYLNMTRECLRSRFSITSVSSVYESSPIGYLAQRDFLNQVVEIESDESVEYLFSFTQEIELSMGKKAPVKWGPRYVDIDILLFGSEVVNDEDLINPHGEMINRRFVLEPLCEINSELVMPSTNVPVVSYLESIQNQVVHKYRGVDNAV